MGEMFSTIADACVWLYTQGFRQNEHGHWLKGKRQAEIRRSPANDGVVCVVMRNARLTPVPLSTHDESVMALGSACDKQ